MKDPARVVAAGGSRTDGVTILTVYIVLLMAIPSNYVVGPIGSAGAPAQLVGLGMLLWWVARRLARSFPTSPATQPVRRAMLVFAAAVLASYIAATVRPIEAIELRAADRGLLALLSWVGVILVAGDEIPSRARLDTFLRRLVLAGGAVGALGVIQFQTGMAFTDYFKLPGLSENTELASVVQRSGFLRPAGTAIHPIEFGVSVSMLLPIALHLALTDRHAGKVRRWFPVIAIAVAIPLSVSRSAIVCTVVAMAFMLPALDRRTRHAIWAAGAALLGVVYVTVPGMLGAITGLFTGISGDSSALSRTDSYDLAGEFIARAPVLGRGFGTFLPEYRILDNQYLGALIELGIVGLVALMVLFLTGMRTASYVRRRSRDATRSQLAQALLASLAAGSASFAFFDALSFPMVAALVFLVLGVIGSLNRLTPQSAVHGGLSPERRSVSRHREAGQGSIPAPR